MTSSFFAVIRNIKVKLSFQNADELDKIAIELAKKQIKRTKLGSKVILDSGFVYKKSVDAREKNNILLVYSIAFLIESVVLGIKISGIDIIENCDFEKEFCFAKYVDKRPLVVGFGPCGMFCALVLAKAGLRPIIIERGDDVDKRTEKVNRYWTESVLDSNTNVQFGEGGAGTFSDGKLLTRISDKYCRYVLDVFVKHGAPEEIKYLAKPHIGTDNLRNVVKNIRNEIISLGGEVYFNTQLTGINVDLSGRITSVNLKNSQSIECDCVFLCIGHSARDTVLSLLKQNVSVEPKPFSVGVRIEHLRQNIDAALYGDFAGCKALGAASYTLSAKFDNRAVYSFCMCPGGVVVASASDDGQIVTNGMSNFARDGINSNSAIAVSVNTSDYGNTVMGAIEFQESIERNAFNLCGGDGTAPIQLVGDFLDGKLNNEPSVVLPTYTGKTKLLSCESVHPSFVTNALKQGIRKFENDIKGFSDRNSVLTFPETRTSSPVKIPRNDLYLAYGFKNLYPCGEGAGYAGGITSAAVDGIRTALAYLNNQENI